MNIVIERTLFDNKFIQFCVWLIIVAQINILFDNVI